mgnify:FL=1
MGIVCLFIFNSFFTIFSQEKVLAVEENQISLFSSEVSFSQNDFHLVDSQALGDDLLLLDLEEGILPMTEIESQPTGENKKQKTSQNSVQEKERKEIIVYTVKEGDVLSKIAQKFGLKTQTLLWANNLTENSIIRPGDKITIPPKDGIIYTVKRGDTLIEIAKRYKADVEEIKKFNQLDSDIIVEGEKLFLPNAKMPSIYLASRRGSFSRSSFAGSSRRRSFSSYLSSSKRHISYSSSKCHRFPYGYCTWWVAKKRGCIPWGGNAKDWLWNARAYGFATGKVPVVGAIMVTRESWWGHVAYVEKVSGDYVTISEMNRYGWGRVNYRTLHKNDWRIRGYIYWKR